MTTDTDLPKQELLIKLLKMTTVSEDTMAVVAIRKANALLDAAGWDWERLIQGKIKVIEDPFKNLGTPTVQPARFTQPAPAAPVRSAPSGYAAAPPKRTTWPLGISVNNYAGFCYCCGTEVLAQAGFIFKPITHNARGSSDWKVACAPCNGTNTLAGATVYDYPRARVKPKRGRHSLTDLA